MIFLKKIVLNFVFSTIDCPVKPNKQSITWHKLLILNNRKECALNFEMDRPEMHVYMWIIIIFYAFALLLKKSSHIEDCKKKKKIM